MRTVLAVAIVSAIVVSGQAQAPTSLPGPTITKWSDGVILKFADGSELRAENMISADPVTATEFRITRGEEAQMFENGQWKPVPAPTEFILSGEVRLRMGVR